MLEERTGLDKDKAYMTAKDRVIGYLENPAEATENVAKVALGYMSIASRLYASLRNNVSTQFRIYQFISKDPQEVKKRIEKSMPYLIK